MTIQLQNDVSIICLFHSTKRIVSAIFTTVFFCVRKQFLKKTCFAFCARFWKLVFFKTHTFPLDTEKSAFTKKNEYLFDDTEKDKWITKTYWNDTHHLFSFNSSFIFVFHFYFSFKNATYELTPPADRTIINTEKFWINRFLYFDSIANESLSVLWHMTLHSAPEPFWVLFPTEMWVKANGTVDEWYFSRLRSVFCRLKWGGDGSIIAFVFVGISRIRIPATIIDVACCGWLG